MKINTAEIHIPIMLRIRAEAIKVRTVKSVSSCAELRTLFDHKKAIIPSTKVTGKQNTTASPLVEINPKIKIGTTEVFVPISALICMPPVSYFLRIDTMKPRIMSNKRDDTQNTQNIPSNRPATTNPIKHLFSSSKLASRIALFPITHAAAPNGSDRGGNGKNHITLSTPNTKVKITFLYLSSVGMATSLTRSLESWNYGVVKSYK